MVWTSGDALECREDREEDGPIALRRVDAPDELRPLPSEAPLPRQDFEARLAYRDQRDLAHGKDAVRQDQEEDQEGLEGDAL